MSLHVGRTVTEGLAQRDRSPGTISTVPTPPTPDSVTASLLEHFFGSPSLVVATFLILNALWAWWGLARGTVTLSSVLLDRSWDSLDVGSFKVRATLKTAVAWILCYLPASFVTQLWAGSQFSPGQGGGLSELLRWSGLFGCLTVVGCLYIVPSSGPVHGDQHWAPLIGLFGGYLLGLIWAVIAFTEKGGPGPGDWWVCPAMSCIGVVGAGVRMRSKVISSRT